MATAPISAAPRQVNLQDVLTTENITNSGILNDPTVRQELVQHLPEGQRSDEFIEENIRSPQFQQALGALNDVLQSDGGSGVLASLGLNPQDGVEELVSFE